MDFLKDLSLDKVRNLAEDAFNQAKPKTEVEARVYEVLSHKNWGSSTSLMNEIARDTFDYDKFTVIAQLMWESMENQRPAAWRVVFKGLTLLEHLVKNGSERCVDDARNHGHVLRALHRFNYYEGTVDRGLGVREKSKQLVDMLSDDERVREERMKARKMREKLGKAGVAAAGGGAQYAGYGNDNWNSSGYAQGGIDSEASRGGGAGGGGRYGGRYDDRDTRAPAPAPEPAPTFAALPDDPPKKLKKGKKKKQKDDEASAPAQQVDLFAFDASAAPASAQNDDDFDAFQSASGTAAPSIANDPFATPQQSLPLNDPFAASQPSATFGAFGSNPQRQVPMPNNSAGGFDAFAGNGGMSQMGGMNNNMAFPNNNTMGMMNAGVMQQQQKSATGAVMGNNTNIMGSNRAMGMAKPEAQSAADDDEFGDFAAAGSPSKAGQASSSSSSDPLSKLISLDGLSKNTKKEDKLNQPVIANKAAATYVQEKEQIQAALKQSSKGSAMSFQGIDGLHKSSGMMLGGAMMSPAATVPSNPSVMGSSSSADAISNVFDPSAMTQNKMNSNMNQNQMMMNNQANMMGIGMQQQGMMSPQGMMGANNMGLMGPGNMGMMGVSNMGMMGGTQQPMMAGANMNMMAGTQKPMMAGANMGMMPGTVQPMMAGANMGMMGGANMGMMGANNMMAGNQQQSMMAGANMGMMNPGMMQGNMMNPQQMMMMNNSQGMGGMPNGMGMQNPMGGFR